MYPGAFDKIGKQEGTVKLHLKESAQPFIDAPGKYSIHEKKKYVDELNRMEKLGIIKPITEHTDWCSSIAKQEKPDRSIRLCLDPRKLNENLKRSLPDSGVFNWTRRVKN
jgi:hypothetical protein